MSQNKAKQKGVEIKDAEDSDRPRPTLTRSVLTLNHLSKIDRKDKGKKVLEEESESDAESEGINKAERKFAQLANDEEIARKFTNEERAKLLHDTIAAQRRFLTQQRAVEIRSRPPTRTQLRNQMMTYLKHVGRKKHSDLKTNNFEEKQVLYEKVKRSDENFIAIGSAEDERLIKDVNKKATGIKKDDNIKEESKEEESTRKRKLGTRKKIKSRKRRFRQDTSQDDKTDSKKENGELRLCLTIAPDEDKEVDYEILDKKYPIIEWKIEYLGIKPQFDETKGLEEINLNVKLVMDRYHDEVPEGFNRVLWGDLMIMFNPNDEDEFWKLQQDWNVVSWKLHGSSGVHTLMTETRLVIHMLVEKKYPLRKKVLLKMLELKLESEEDSIMALELIRFVKKSITELELEHSDGDEEDLLVLDQTIPGKDKSNPLIVDSLLKTIRFSIHLVVYNEELAIPEQTATGKGTSNPLMAGSLPKTTKPTIVSRQGESYFITFTNDFSRYGYVYLLKHKHEVFETFKVFQKEVENQLGKTIKLLCSDREGEYMSQELLGHLKDHGIIAHRTPPYTPKHNSVSERRNRTLLDMVRSMISQITLPKSFWDYALETAARILNMVPTKKALVKRDTLTKPNKLEPKSVKCIFIGYPKETMGYYFYYPPENKVLVAQNAKFLENSLITQEASGSLEDLEIIQEKDTHPSIETSLSHEEGDLEIDEPQSDIIPIRRSTRTRHAPDRMCLYIDAKEHELGDLGEPANYKSTLLDPESNKWLNAMNVEIQSMKDNEVWDLVDLPPNGKTLGSKWLFKKKTNMDGAVHTYKAHLVAKGYTQTPGIDYEETFSLVANIRAIRILIAIAVYYDYEIWKIDVKTAFLNGYLSEEVYMEQPKGFVNPKYPNRVCKLKRSIYIPNRSNVTFLILYVDDMLIMGNHIPMLQDVKSYLKRCFAIKDLGEAAYILGIKIYRDRSRRLIGLCESAYIDKILKRFHMENSKRGSIPMQEKLRLSKSQGDLYWTTIKNILKYLMNTKDMFLVYGGVVDWKSTKQSIFTTSSTEAEYIAAYDASKEALWVRKFISGLGVVPTIEEPINMYCDNTGAITIANESGITKGARHFRAKVHCLREVIKYGNINLEKVHTDDNLADPFTKALAFPKHSEHTKNIGMLPASSLM
ncbi:retrotransposon protein, putative, ty1-copia subclass [Tanacetum coccineum]